MEKGGGWKTSRTTPLPKRGFGPPLVRYVFHPPQASALCFSCTKIHDRADQKLFWRGPKIIGRARSLVRFPPPYVLHPPISRPKLEALQALAALSLPRPSKTLHTMQTSRITLPHFIVWDLISVIVTPPSTPNNFRGVKKRNLQEKLHLLVVTFSERISPPSTPKYSQIIIWRNKFHLG